MDICKLLVGGNYFLADQVKFFDNPIFHQASDRLDVEVIDWTDVIKKKPHKVDAPCAMVFGLKTWTRLARKKHGMGWSEIIPRIHRYLKHAVGDKPIGVFDDLSTKEVRHHGERMQRMFFDNFDCRFYLLREGMKKQQYDKRVKPFTMPCKDFTYLAKPIKDKQLDIFFRGNESDPERVKFFKQYQKTKHDMRADVIVYRGGDRAKERLSHEQFMAKMADSVFNFHFKGTGYCCYRYQEIASSGSIIVSPSYPHLVSHDYVDMESCIIYRSFDDMMSKMRQLLKRPERLQEMQDRSIENFRKYHTTEKRFEELLESIELLGR
tara:strand:- start:36927 stop:37892 length:966 start_codon:yes stop_codon:yes gene_type:complete